jgi:hypothetical protein
MKDLAIMHAYRSGQFDEQSFKRALYYYYNIKLLPFLPRDLWTVSRKIQFT